MAFSGLNTGGYRLSEKPHVIAQHMMDMIYKYAKSNDGLKLNNNFRVELKLLDLPHSLETIEEGRVFEPRYGSGGENKAYQGGHVFTTPSGYEGNENAFDNQCLVVSLILASLHQKNLKDPRSKHGMAFTNMKKKASARNLLRKGSGIALLDYLVRWKQLYQLKDDGPYALKDITGVVDRNNVQLHIYSLEDPAFKVFSYPEKYDASKEQWSLLQSTTEDGLCHTDVITQLKMFSTKNKMFYCFGCGKVFRSVELKDIIPV